LNDNFLSDRRKQGDCCGETLVLGGFPNLGFEASAGYVFISLF